MTRQRRVAPGRRPAVEARKAQIAAIRRQADAVRRAAVELIVEAPADEPAVRTPALARAAMLLDGARQMEQDATALERTFLHVDEHPGLGSGSGSGRDRS